MYNGRFPIELITTGTEGIVQIVTKERQVQTVSNYTARSDSLGFSTLNTVFTHYCLPSVEVLAPKQEKEEKSLTSFL